MLVLNTFSTTVEKALGEIDSKWRDYPGLIVCGTHSPTDVEQMLIYIKDARESGLPFLGICAGYQLASIEYARYVLGIKDATSEEFGVPGTFIVTKRPELKVGLHDNETWWSNYDIDPQYEIQFPLNFFAVGFHPEYQSSKNRPHPLLVSFLKYAKHYEVAS